MRLPKETTQSFVIRIWIEQRDFTDAEPEWRGVIENVSNGERVYFNKLDQVVIHLTSSIEAMGGRVAKL